jgi:hypothetical protein
MPRELPVTTAVFPFNERDMIHLRLLKRQYITLCCRAGKFYLALLMKTMCENSER